MFLPVTKHLMLDAWLTLAVVPLVLNLAVRGITQLFAATSSRKGLSMDFEQAREKIAAGKRVGLRYVGEPVPGDRVVLQVVTTDTGDRRALIQNPRMPKPEWVPVRRGDIFFLAD